MAVVINVKVAELRKRGYNSFLEWASDPKHVYVGRNMTVYVPGTVASPLANPYSAKQFGRRECVEKYIELLKRSPDMIEKIRQMKQAGVTEIGCWCAPELCHGDIIAALINQDLKQEDKN